VSYDLSVVPQNRWGDKEGVRHASRSSGLFHMEESRARISQSGLRTDGGTVRMVHVASSWWSRGDEAKDERVDAMGCIELFYPNFAVFVVLGHEKPSGQ
jgi:hypothetical protein